MRGRFVENQQGGILEKGAGQGEALQLSSTQAASLLTDLRIKALGKLLDKLQSARLLSSLLFQTTRTDVMSVSISIGALLLVTLAAVALPAARAASVDPVEALRSE